MIKSVLIVDDDNICNFLTINALKKAGVRGKIDVVLNGLEAIKKLKENNSFPNLILLDINMPVMDGIDFLRNYKSEGFEGKTKIAMYTSSIREIDKYQALEYEDVFDFINKPISQKKLINLIKQL
ncbi:MAG: response regulator [Flavobacteriales bacterium]|nr:response regulator [Flavobacteriales bacterium]|tara:strand:- start:6230 stop:6604 length:375 start_codon:yes stop_codon:yes gene_type:complete